MEYAVEAVQWEFENLQENDEDRIKLIEKMISQTDHPFGRLSIGKYLIYSYRINAAFNFLTFIKC